MQDAPPEIVVTGLALPAVAAAGVRVAAEPAVSGRLETALGDLGLAAFRRGDARSANPTAQGVTARGLGGNAAARALVLLDGVPQGDPFAGWVAWPVLGMAGEARVVRGAGLAPGALAGTALLESPGLDDAPVLEAAGGSRGSVRARGAATWAAGAGAVTLTGLAERGDGFVPVVRAGAVDRRAAYGQAAGAARFVMPVGGAEVQARVAGFSDRRVRGVGDGRSLVEGGDASVRVVGRGRWGYEALVWGQVRGFANRAVAADAGRGSFAVTLDQVATPASGWGASVEVRPPLAGVTLALGADVRDAAGRSFELFQFAGGVPARFRRAGGASRILGARAELATALGAVEVSAGARVDRWSLRGGALEEGPVGGAAVATAYADRNATVATGRVGLGWRPVPAWTLRAAWRTGWRPPTLNELYRPFRVATDVTLANPDLAPERLREWEAGVDWRPVGGARLSVTAFDARLAGAVANATLFDGPGVFPGAGFVPAGGVVRRRANLGAIRSRGVEVDAEARVGPWRAWASGGYVDARTDAGLRPAQVASVRAAGGVRRESVAWDAGAAVRFVGAQFDDDANRRRLRPALTVDADVRVRLRPGVALVAAAENLLDATVEAGAAGGVVERATPRTLWLGVRLGG